MKIEINNDEINQAIKDYVISQGIDVVNSDVDVEFIAGRKKGNTAHVTITLKGAVDGTSGTEVNTDPEETTAGEEADGEKLDLFNKT